MIALAALGLFAAVCKVAVPHAKNVRSAEGLRTDSTGEVNLMLTDEELQELFKNEKVAEILGRAQRRWNQEQQAQKVDSK